MEPQAISTANTHDRIVPERLILDRLHHDRRFTVEELLEQMPELSWAQVFFAMDILSRRGDVELRRQGFTYTVRKIRPFDHGMEGVDDTAHHDHR